MPNVTKFNSNHLLSPSFSESDWTSWRKWDRRLRDSWQFHDIGASYLKRMAHSHKEFAFLFLRQCKTFNFRWIWLCKWKNKQLNFLSTEVVKVPLRSWISMCRIVHPQETGKRRRKLALIEKAGLNGEEGKAFWTVLVFRLQLMTLEKLHVLLIFPFLFENHPDPMSEDPPSPTQPRQMQHQNWTSLCCPWPRSYFSSDLTTCLRVDGIGNNHKRIREHLALGRYLPL